MTEKLFIILVIMLTMKTCFGDLTLFGWSNPRDNGKQSTTENSPSKNSCGRHNQPCNEKKDNHDEDIESFDDENEEYSYRDKGNSDNNGIFVAKPRFDTDILDTDENDDDLDEDENEDDYEDEILDEEDEGYDEEDEFNNRRITKQTQDFPEEHQRWVIPSNRLDKMRKFRPSRPGQLRLQKKQKRKMENSKRSRLAAGETSTRRDKRTLIGYPDTPMDESYYDDEIGAPFRAKGPKYNDEEVSDYYYDETGTLYTNVFDRSRLVKRPEENRECCDCVQSGDKKAASTASQVESPSNDLLKQAADPVNPVEKKEVTSPSHLYRTSLLVAFIWFFNVAFVIWSMTRKNYVIKMKVPNNVDSKHPLISDNHKNALNERRDKTSQSAVHKSRNYHKHRSPAEGDSNFPIPLSRPQFSPSPINEVSPKDTTANHELTSQCNSLTDIPARLYFKDVQEQGRYNQLNSSSYLNTQSRLVKEYSHNSGRFDYHDLRLDQATRNHEETTQASLPVANLIGEIKTRKSRPVYSSGMVGLNEKVPAENNSNYTVPKLPLYEERSSWTEDRKMNYSSFGVNHSYNINNQHFSDDKKTSKDFMPAHNNFFLNRDLPRSISPLFNERIKARSLSNAAAHVNSNHEDNILKLSRMKRSLSATTQCPSVHSVKYEQKLNASRIEGQNLNVAEPVGNTIVTPLSTKKENIQVQTEEKSPVKNTESMKNTETILSPTKIADVLARYLDQVNEASMKLKGSPEIKPETERTKAKENLYKLFSTYGNQLQNCSSLDSGRNRPKPVMPPPPLGYHIRSCCSSSDTTLRELESKSEISDQVPTSGEQTSQGHVTEKKRKRKGLKHGHTHSPQKMKASERGDKLLLDQTMMKQMCAGDGEIRKKYVIVRKVSFSKALKHGNDTHLSRRKSNADEKRLEKRERNIQEIEYLDNNNTKQKRSSSKREANEMHQTVTRIPYFQNKHPKPSKSESKKYLLYLCEPSDTTQVKGRGKNCTVSSHIRYAERNTNNDTDYLQDTLNTISLNKLNEIKIKHPCFNYRPVLKRKHSYKKSLPYGDKFITSVPCALDINTNNGGSSDKEDGDSSGESGEAKDLVSLTDVTDSTVVPPIEDENMEENAEEQSSMYEPEIKKERTPVKTSKSASPTSKTPVVEDAWENRKSIIMQACHEAIKSRLHKQNSEDGCADDKSATVSTVEIERKLSLPTKLHQEQQSEEKSRSSTPSSDEINKRKKKAKTTESMFVKFESNRKATTTKDRKAISSKASLDRKTGEDTRLEETEKKAHSDIVKGTKMVKKNETESDKKKRHNSESCSETTSAKDNMLNSWEVQETEEEILNSKDSDHCFDAVKDLLSAACKGEDFGVSKQLSIQNSSSPNLTSTKNMLDEVKVKNVTSDTITDKGSKFRSSDNAISRSASDVKDTTRKSESSSSHKLKERVAKRSRHKGTGSPLGQKKTIKKKRSSTSRSKKTSDEGSKEKSKDPLKKTHFLAVSKKSPSRTGSTKSGENKIKKKTSKTKESHGDETSTSEIKPEKVKTKKISEKSEKKRKKIKKREESEQLSEKEENSCMAKHSASAPVRIPSRQRSDTPSPRSCSSPICRSASPDGTPTKGRAKERKSSKKSSKSEISLDSDKSQTAEKSRSLDRELSTSEKSKGRKKSGWASSAENIGATGTSKRLRSTESVPLFVDKVLSNQSLKSDKDKPTPTTSSAKLKKGEKDLQRAELGWNSSLAYDNLKQAEEKTKMLQSRKIKYLIVKARQDKIKPRLRNSTQRSNPAEGETAGSHSENESKSDVMSRDKVSGVGIQPKSVQFSESIEDMEAQKNAAASDGYLESSSNLDIETKQRSGDNSDSVDDIGSVDKPPEIMESIKEKSQEVTQRSQSTPPARKRPIWLKGKKLDDPKASDKQGMQPRQSLSGLPTKLKLRHSSDTLMKGTRVSGHLYYPGKPSVSPKTNSTSLNTKTAASRNASLSSAQATAPPTKSKKKAIATVGSPVDLMEIIEGSSVDASDHSKAFVVRPTKSVPAFGHSRGGPDAVGGKRLKSAFEQRVLASKRKHRILDNLSIRSVSSNDTGDEHLRSLGKSYDQMTSPTPSVMTDLDEVASLSRFGPSSSGLHGNIRRKDKKIKKRVPTVNNNINWQPLANQDQDIAPRVPYDYSDYQDVFQLGLSWMVQRFFNRITSFSPGQRSNPNASGDMSIQRIAE